MSPCAYCGGDKARYETTVDAELFIEDREYSIKPSFCSWQHAAAWFAQPPPDVSAWTRTGKAPKAPADGGVVTWLLLVLLIVLLLVTVVVLGVTLS